MAKKVYCWCGNELISEVMRGGEWFPLGFLNCWDHGCWYETEEEWNKHLADEFEKAGIPQARIWGSVLY